MSQQFEQSLRETKTKVCHQTLDEQDKLREPISTSWSQMHLFCEENMTETFQPLSQLWHNLLSTSPVLICCWSSSWSYSWWTSAGCFSKSKLRKPFQHIAAEHTLFRDQYESQSAHGTAQQSKQYLLYVDVLDLWKNHVFNFFKLLTDSSNNKNQNHSAQALKRNFPFY